MSKPDNTLEAWLDDRLGSAQLVGMPAHDRASFTNSPRKPAWTYRLRS